MSMIMDPTAAPVEGLGGKKRKTLVLCFDGTGNKFQGDDGDSNIIKIYSMLDRANTETYSYYQPGIGTYVHGSALSKTGRFAKISSAYAKAKDQAVGTSFADHVVSGYKFLMRHYTAGDDIYMFGFSRGAYTARFLAQMLDYVGLLSSGNEEMVRFAWKTFQKWQMRIDTTEEEKEKKAQQYEFMQKFRDTFSRPVRRIRFLGLFDCVNSVPKFENAWMRRSKVPYTAKSSAKVIRHAVSIDERRAKFRQDLISQRNITHQHAQGEHPHLHHALHPFEQEEHHEKYMTQHQAPTTPTPATGRFRPHLDENSREAERSRSHTRDASQARTRSTTNPQASSPDRSNPRESQLSVKTRSSSDSLNSTTAVRETIQRGIDHDEAEPQDIQEIWFPGCHADIGGGWRLVEGEEVSLSHAPLMWMLREARAAGLPFNEDSLRRKNYILEDTKPPPPSAGGAANGRSGAITSTGAVTNVPMLEVDGEPISSPTTEKSPEQLAARHDFLRKMELGATRGHIHDSLTPSAGVTLGSSIAWRCMEYLPFRRMDLQRDGSWEPIRWPLPMGETRDIPKTAWISSTALRRMETNPKYRPGNLIVGGGGRGTRVAPPNYGTGKWRILREESDPIAEVLVREDVHSNFARTGTH